MKFFSFQNIFFIIKPHFQKYLQNWILGIFNFFQIKIFFCILSIFFSDFLKISQKFQYSGSPSPRGLGRFDRLDACQRAARQPTSRPRGTSDRCAVEGARDVGLQEARIRTDRRGEECSRRVVFCREEPVGADERVAGDSGHSGAAGQGRHCRNRLRVHQDTG